MAILKNANCRIAFGTLLICLVFCPSLRAEPREPILGFEIGNDSAEECANQPSSEAAQIKSQIEQCDDDSEKAVLKYRLGIAYFQIADYGNAESCFCELKDSIFLLPTQQLKALHMQAVCLRLLGQDSQAIDTLDSLAEMCKQIMHEGDRQQTEDLPAHLFELTQLAKAELHEKSYQWRQAVFQLEQLLTFRQGRFRPYYTGDAELIDRISDRCLRTVDLEGYRKCVDLLMKSYANYNRVGLVWIENECVEFLEDFNYDFDYENGTSGVCVEVIRLAQSANDKQAFEKILLSFSLQADREQNPACRLILGYHYACLLDAIGEKDNAMQVFEQLSLTDTSVFDQPVPAEIERITAYSSIRAAILHAEKQDYQHAKSIINQITDTAATHIRGLVESVSESLQTLIREDIVHEKK